MNRYLVCMNDDERMIHCVQTMEEKGPVMRVETQEALERFVKAREYTHLLLPITGVDNTLTIRGSKLTLSDLMPFLEGKTILTGLVAERLEEEATLYRVNVVSYMTEAFAIDNNYITAEGLVASLVQASNKAIYGSNVVIVGYGRLGQILCKVLTPFRCNLTVVVRDEKDATKVKIDGHTPLFYDEIGDVFGRMDTMITTVPAHVLTHEHLDQMALGKHLLIDLSSPPHSFDHPYAIDKGMNVHLLPGLPGRIAPITSGELMAKYILMS